MCLIVIDTVNVNACLYNTTERIVSSEDNLVNTSSLTDSIMTLNLLNFGAATKGSLTTVNVEELSIDITIESSPKLITELVCQQNTWGDHYNSLWGGSSSQTTLSILDHDDSLATARRNDNLTMSVVLKSSKSTLLMGAKSNGQVCFLC